MREQLTLAVIGHVDHGKTALVRALTGIETDRLAEEKARGLSIVLGFSYMETSRGIMIDFIDAPGHEDFVRTMISGATGVDGALLVIAANESVMPQTREHLDIARLLGLDRGLIVINKTDLVDEEELEIARLEIEELVAGTFLSDAPIVYTSATQANGIDSLRAALEDLEPAQRASSAGDDFFLPIDRAFVMRGFGPVVTGTLRGGELRASAEVELLPEQASATIRGLQVHNEPVESAWPGQRVAVNLRNVRSEDLRRGQVLAKPGAYESSRRIDVELDLLGSQSTPLKNGAVVRLLIGTSEAMATIRLLDADRLEPGARGLVQLRLDREIATPRSERFIIRTYSPARTIGGGRVLDPNASRHRRFDASVMERLSHTAEGSSAQMLRDRLAEAGRAGVESEDLRRDLGLGEDELAGDLEAVGALVIEGRCFDSRVDAELREAIVTALGSHHEDHPRQLGVSAASLLGALGSGTDRAVFQYALDSLVAEGSVERRDSLLCLAGFDPLAELSDRERKLAAELEETFRDADLVPPAFDQVVGRDKARRDLVQLLIETGQLVRLKTRDRKAVLVLHRESLARAVAALRENCSESEGFAVAQARDVLGSTRKYIVPLLEHLDASGVTIRIGDLRQFRPGGGE